MRKATGKVVSLVLALALVITSFSATFASAATKTESGTASWNGISDTVYLANTADQNAPVSTDKTKFNLSAYLNGVTLNTYDHISVEDPEITQVSVSGDNIVRVEKNGTDDPQYNLIVRDQKGTGTAVLNVLFTGTENRGDDEITVRASLKLTVKLLDSKTPILAPSIPAPGKGVDSFDTLQKNPNAVSLEIDDSSMPASTMTAYVVVPTTSASSAEATYVAAEIAQKVSTNQDTAYSGKAYIVDTTGTRDYLNVADDSENRDQITFGIGKPSVGSTVRLTLYSINSDGDDIAKTLSQVTVRVENKVVDEFTSIASGDATYAYVNGDSSEEVILSKSKTYAFDSTNRMYWEVTGAKVVTTGDLTVNSGRIGDLTVKYDDTDTDGEIDAGEESTLIINDGTIGNVVVDGDINVYGGDVTSLKAPGYDISIIDATVGEVKDAADVTVQSGKVSGAVSATNVAVSPLSDEDSASVGAVTATTLTVDGTNGKATAASYKASATSSSLTLTGSNATVGAIDVDYRNTTISLNGFVGTIPAPTKANYTGYDFTGATLTTDLSGDTKATVSGALNVYNLMLESGAVTFTDSLRVANLTGGDADLVINAGDLYVSDMLGTSNTLKIANPADVKAGTLVFTAAPDIADIDSFVRYGYDLKVVNGTSYDGFVIDSVDFAGLTLDVGSSLELTVGETVTVTASAYPAGTKLPEGTKVEFYLNGDLNYIEGKNIGNNQATVTAVAYSEDFDVLNKGTLTAVVLDEFDIQLEEYGEAVCDITVVKTKAPTETYKSDTTGDVVVPSGNTYQFKITSLNGQAPSVVLGSDGVFELVGTAQEGNDYFFKFQAVGAAGAATGVYVNGDAKVATMYVDGNTGYTCDTTTVNVPAGGTYQVKITAASMPTLLPGNSIYTVAFASQEGNDYFFRITATSAQAGDVVGFYINGGARAFVATTV